MRLKYPVYVYPNAELTGDAVRAPAGIPCEIARTVTHGKGKNKTARHLVKTAAPAGWGEWSGRAFFGWVDAHYVEVQS